MDDEGAIRRRRRQSAFLCQSLLLLPPLSFPNVLVLFSFSTRFANVCLFLCSQRASRCHPLELYLCQKLRGGHRSTRSQIWLQAQSCVAFARHSRTAEVNVGVTAGRDIPSAPQAAPPYTHTHTHHSSACKEQHIVSCYYFHLHCPHSVIVVGPPVKFIVPPPFSLSLSLPFCFFLLDSSYVVSLPQLDGGVLCMWGRR